MFPRFLDSSLTNGSLLSEIQSDKDWGNTDPFVSGIGGQARTPALHAVFSATLATGVQILHSYGLPGCFQWQH